MYKRDVDSFCYICGKFIKVGEKKYDPSPNLKICDATHIKLTYFNLPVKNLSVCRSKIGDYTSGLIRETSTKHDI